MDGGDRSAPKESIAMRSKICAYSPHFSLAQISHLETGRRVIPCLFCEDEAFRIMKSSDRAAKFLSQIDCVKIFTVSTNIFCYSICGLGVFAESK